MGPSQALGIVEQRRFPLRRASGSDAILFLDAVFVQPSVVGHLLSVLESGNCGFVGALPTGLTCAKDVRPDKKYGFGKDRPEVIEAEGRSRQQRQLHRAPRLHHVAEKRAIPPSEFLRYKVVWIGSCVLYDRKKLLEVGGFSFQDRLPRYHTGEDVVVQNLPRRYGGCGVVPSGTSTPPQSRRPTFSPSGAVEDVGLDLFSEIIER